MQLNRDAIRWRFEVLPPAAQQRPGHFLICLFSCVMFLCSKINHGVHFLCHLVLDTSWSSCWPKNSSQESLLSFRYILVQLFVYCKAFCCVQVTQTELERLKNGYRQAVKDVAQAKRKYQEANKGGFLLSPTSIIKSDGTLFSLCNCAGFTLFHSRVQGQNEYHIDWLF